MDELNSLRLSGHAAPLPLTPAAQATLQRYLDQTRAGLRSEADADEIIRDVESAIGDHLMDLRATNTHPVSEEQMSAILTEIGPASPTHGASPEPVDAALPRGRFWCRIEDGKWFGGICLGLAAYGSFRVDWVRTVVLLLTLFTGGILAVVYLILLLMLPVVPTVAEYEHLRDGPRTRTRI